jgi:hypothetical protein
MTPRYHGDCCPACGSHQIIPYAILVGSSEEFGCQCLACEVMWPVLTFRTREKAEAVGHKRNPAA